MGAAALVRSRRMTSLPFGRRLPLAVATATALGVHVLVACVGDDPDVTPPGSTSDSGATVTDSATPDATSDADAAPPHTFCTDVDADFCEDFDRSAEPPWSLALLRTNEGAGIVTANDQAFRSAPRSAKIHLAPLDGGFDGVLLRATVPAKDATGARVECDWRIDVADPPTAVSVTDVFNLQVDGVGGVALHRETSLTEALLSVGPDNAVAPIAQPAPAWNHVAYDVRFADDDGGGGKGTFKLDQASVELGPKMPKRPTATVAFFLGGSSVSGTSPKLHMSFDNLVIRLVR